MAGMDHFKAALVIAAGESARYAVRGLEAIHGHATTGHGTDHETDAHDSAEADTTGSANVDAALATWLAALDARYAAGATPGPIMSDAGWRGLFGSMANAVAKYTIEDEEADHGRAARGLARSAAKATAAQTAVDAAVHSEVELFLADLDARYAAGATVAAPGVVMDGCLAALKLGANYATGGGAVRVFEQSCRGHWTAGGHWQPHANAASADAEDALDAIAPTLLVLLGFLDARYQAHA